MKVIILAGGNGTRLWPLSRTNYPKQFLKLKQKDCSLFQMTFQRSLKLTSIDQIYIVTNEKHKFLVQGQVEELGYLLPESQVLIEPIGKNTLPAIYYGVQHIQQFGEDVIAVFPSDHLIGDDEMFVGHIKQGKELVSDYLVTFGIRPDKPHTGYGYIKPSTPVYHGYEVAEFKEKPDADTAEEYIRAGYLWNSGMFLIRSDLFTVELKQHCPEVFEAFQADSIADKFEQAPDISIDYGLMEKSNRVAVLPLTVKWSDLGSFDSFYDEYTPDKDGNISFSNEILVDARNNLLYTDSDKTVAIVGAADLIVVDQKDALLICKREHSQKVKDIVTKLKGKQDHRADEHLTTYRPWGSYTILEEGLFYKIKRITVLPGKKLSYQYHYHRSEHWVVVKGTAKVTIEGEETLVHSGESIYVKSGLKHRLENPGKVTLEVIEVQIGEYLGEDDIVRLEDDFGRED